MFRFGSLKTRIIVLTTIPLSALFVAILLGTIHTANNAVRTSVQKSLTDAGSVFVRLLTTRKDELLAMANITVRDPRFFATFSIPETERGEEFVPTLEGITYDFLRITDADFLEVFDSTGEFISRTDRKHGPHSEYQNLGRQGIEKSMKGHAIADFYRSQDHLVMAAVVPVYVAQELEAIVRLGAYLDTDFIMDIKRLTGADIILMQHQDEIATTLPQLSGVDGIPESQTNRNASVALSLESVTLSSAFTLLRDDVEYLSIHARLNGVNPSEGFDTFITRELRTELAPLLRMEKRMALAGVLAVLVTLLAGFFLANSITKPLSNVVNAASALEKGEYDFPLDVVGGDEIAYLGQSFEKMRSSLHKYVDHLKNIDQVKSNFIAVAGHELRTPLTIITGFNDMIMSGALGEIPDDVKETAQHIQTQLTDLNTLVQDILDLSYFEQGLIGLNCQRSDLGEIVREALLKRQDAVMDRKLHLKVDIPDKEMPANVDSQRIEQAFLKLVDNAIRFTPDGGTITVTVSRDDINYRLSVRDTGVGIPANELEWIFDKIYEVGDVLNHSSGKHQFGSRGFGLGLALSKVLIDKHEGSLTVKSTMGRGSEFTISLTAEKHAVNESPVLV